jgi:lipid-A-disaccharide synthase
MGAAAYRISDDFGAALFFATCDTNNVAAPAKILVSAGEASGDRYAARLVEALRERFPCSYFFGCAGPHMRRALVEPVVRSESLSVVGIVEVLRHIPRIYGEYRKLIAAARLQKPDFAILTDSPDFHLRVAARLNKLNIPVFYLVAPQAWAWREGRVSQIRRNVSQLHCIFPFEEEFFRQRGVDAVYIGHPLAQLVRPRVERSYFLQSHGLPADRPLVALCPGSRGGEIARHLPVLLEAVSILAQKYQAQFLLALPEGVPKPALARSVAVVQGETWDAMAHSQLTLAASGTVTVEAALLGAPMVTFYKVNSWSWRLGRPLVRVPFFSMVNLVAGREVVPELIQNELTPQSLAAAAARLLDQPAVLEAQREGLAGVRDRLQAGHDALEYSAGLIAERMKGFPDR